MENYQQQLDDANAEFRAAQIAAKTERTGLATAEKLLTANIEARDIIQTTAHAIQQEAHSRIAGVVTRCLKAVFGDDAYEFQIKFEQKRGRTEARLIFERNGLEIAPLGAAGGGAVDVAAFALRLAALMLQRPPQRRCLVLDEPFRFLSKEYRPVIRELLLELAEELEMQFIVVTHDTEMACGTVVRID